MENEKWLLWNEAYVLKNGILYDEIHVSHVLKICFILREYKMCVINESCIT